MTEIKCPPRFLRAEKGDVAKANARYQKHLGWRAENQVDNVLRTPQRHFDVIKEAYPHYFHQRSLDGCVVQYHCPGRIDWEKLRENGVGLDEMMAHVVFTQEFLWEVLDDRQDEGQSITVLDVTGLRVMGAHANVEFLKALLGLLGEHYPERARNILIINVPWGFDTLWSIIKGFIDPVTRNKIYIERGEARVRAALMELIAEAHVPKEYGGSCPQAMALGNADDEKALVEQKARASSGEKSLVEGGAHAVVVLGGGGALEAHAGPEVGSDRLSSGDGSSSNPLLSDELWGASEPSPAGILLLAAQGKPQNKPTDLLAAPFSVYGELLGDSLTAGGGGDQGLRRARERHHREALQLVAQGRRELKAHLEARSLPRELLGRLVKVGIDSPADALDRSLADDATLMLDAGLTREEIRRLRLPHAAVAPSD
eukprot:CAMPEP_0172590492 /NCGR_PEP_ID=MMETSP1068-20121228/9011_1 /TAXON_ID=35684 /ORGANISM="Pseudopedinella elastica, Strain CCMP716" /LENGTH=427 /DNA_ID=CAMNT_0013386397 /DNA_START=37 /DNA_END=1320 /DNA_ORIENTATION=-